MPKHRKLGLCFTLVLFGVSIAGLCVIAGVFSVILKRNAESEVSSKALLLLDSMKAVRDYNAEQVEPLLAAQSQTTFLPQSVHAYAVRETFRQLYTNSGYSQFRYKQAALNPFNPKDQANSFEAGLIGRFRTETDTKILSGYLSQPKGDVFYIARPITISQSSCLSCHGTPAAAPKSLVERYGTDHGFGWKLGEVVGAHVVSVPVGIPLGNAVESFFVFMGVVVLTLAAVKFAILWLLQQAVIKPLTRVTRIAQDVSMGKLDMELSPVPLSPLLYSSDEIGDLATAFTRMRRSVVKGLRIIQSLYHNRGRELYAQGDLEGAVVELRTALELKPDCVDTHIDLGRALADKGDTAGAVEQYCAALRLKSEDPEIHHQLGKLLCDQGEGELGVEQLRAAIELYQQQGEKARARDIDQFLGSLLAAEKR